MMPTDSSVIAVENLTKRYGDLVAVNDVSFTVGQGEVFAFLGPNGAGKSTTVEIIETIRTPDAGKVTLLGVDVMTHRRDILPRIGVLPQGFSSFDRLTVRESIQYYARLFGRRDADLDRLIALTNLQSKRDVPFRNLSGGLKQRLGIAIALVNDPEIIFLDEPTTGLDPRARREVWEVLLGLKSQGKTVFLTTHYMEEAELLADTVAIISKGRIVTVGSPDELVEANNSELTVTLKPADDGALDVLRGLGFDPTFDKHRNLRIGVKQAGDVQGVLAALEDANVPLPGLDVRKPNLEEVFLKITGEALREQEDS